MNPEFLEARRFEGFRGVPGEGGRKENRGERLDMVDNRIKTQGPSGSLVRYAQCKRGVKVGESELAVEPGREGEQRVFVRHDEGKGQGGVITGSSVASNSSIECSLGMVVCE